MRNDYSPIGGNGTASEAFAAYLYGLTLDSSWIDDEIGTVEDSIGWNARVGRRIVSQDSQGFTYCERFASERDAIEAIESLGSEIAEFDEWEDDDSEPCACVGALVGEYVKVDRYRGVAWYVDRHCGDEVTAHMVGDDRPFTFGASDVTVIDDSEFCPGCGQMGCGHGA